MKLTDIMFDLEYIAANTGAEFTNRGDIFKFESLQADNTGAIVLSQLPVALVSGGKSMVWYKSATNTNGEYKKLAQDTPSTSVSLGSAFANQEVCVMYRYTNDFVQQITISSQFIPDTLHAVLTIALYAGDSCNIETSTKVGEVEIDIPRFQLSGSMDLSMNAVRLVSL